MGKGKAKEGDVHGGDGKSKKGGKNLKPSGVRKVWFPSGFSHGDNLLEDAEYAEAPFALAVEYVPPNKNRYGAKLQIFLRDDDVRALIDRHKLRGIAVYIDRAAVASDARRKDLNKELTTEMDKDPLSYVWSPQLYWMGLRQMSAWLADRSVVRIQFGTLLDGIEVTGSMDEVKRIIREVTMNIDKLAANLDTGSIFDSGETRVFAPGTRKKTKDDAGGTPPSAWGR